MPDDIALVTGATKGVGRQIALRLAADGLFVLATGRNTDDMGRLQKEIKNEGGKCLTVPAELIDEAEVTRLVNQVEKLDGKLTILVHSAGIAKVGTVKDMDLHLWEQTLAINLTSPFLLTRKCLPLMGKGAHIFFINSVSGHETFPEWSAYSASKWGLRALADTLRKEVNGEGIKVTTIYPASVDTPMQENLPYDWDRTKMLKADDIARAVLNCYRQPADVQIKELVIENIAGTF